MAVANNLSPFVYWGQSNKTISLKVDLRNVENVQVTLTEESLDFSAQGLGVKGINMYSFHLDFYAPVDPEKSRYRKTEIAVEFQIDKSVADTWPRLTEKRVKLPWLKIDFDKFPVDDSEEENESENIQKSEDELLNKITQEMEEENRIETPSLKQTYLFIYNLFQFVGYFYIFGSLLINYFRFGESEKTGAFEKAGVQMMVCQLVSTLEIIHPLLRLVKSNVFTTLSQVLARDFVLFVLVLQEPRLQISPLCWYLFVIWSSVELIRYPYYMLQIMDINVKALTWLRYTVWIPLYPVGILIEASIVVQSINYFTETGFFSLALPNSANFAFYFPYFLMVYLVAVSIGGTNNLNHMRLQRQKQLGSKSASSRKVKSS